MKYILSKLLVCLFIFFNEMIVNDSNSCKSLNVFYKSNNNMINNYKNYKISVLSTEAGIDQYGQFSKIQSRDFPGGPTLG